MSIHKTCTENYWRERQKADRYIFKLKIVGFCIFAFILLMVVSCVHGEDIWAEPFTLTGIKVAVLKTAGTKEDPNATIPVAKATVALYDGIIEDIKGGTLRISAPTGPDGIIEMGVQPGVYTVIVTVDGAIKDSISGPDKYPVVCTMNGPDACFYIFK